MMPVRRLALLALVAAPLLAACDNGAPPTAPEADAAQAPAAPASPAAPAPAPAPTEVAVSAESMARLTGTWAADLSWCSGQGSGFPITITDTQFQGRENTCDIAGLTDNGDGSYTAALTCAAEGTQTNERIAFTPLVGPNGLGLGLTYLDRDNAEETLYACGGQQPARR